MSTVRAHAPAKDFRRFRRCTLRVAIVVVAGLLLFYSKLTFDLTPWAQAVTSAATTMKYGTEGHRQTRVLLFTDQDLAFAGNRFPIPYDTHAAVIANLDEDGRRPRALFIDFAFVQPDRKDAASFARLRDAVCKLHTRIPVFVVDPRPVGGDDAAPRESPFGDCAEAVGAVIDEEEPGGGLMTYPACGMAPHHGHGGGGHDGFATRVRRAVLGDDTPCTGPYSAAYALWTVRRPDGSAEALGAVRRDERIALVWPARSEPQSMDLCDLPSGVGALKDAIVDVYTEGAEAFKRRCPYTDTVTAGQLLSSDHDTVEKAGRVLAGATVLYGGKISLGGDVLKSPVYKDLAGVYYHAMAFDNLATFEGRPKRETPPWLRHLVALALVVVATWLALRPQHHAPATPTAGESLQRYVAVLQVVLAFAAIAIVGMVYGALKARIPEYLLLGCFALYLCIRFVTSRSAALTSLACFTFALLMFWWFSISVDIFFSMILFLEVVHLLLHHLGEAARKVRPIARGAMRLRWSERAVLALLDPFMPD